MKSKRRISKEDLERVKRLDLLSYFMNYEPDELIKNGYSDYTTRTHSSLHLSNGLWCWWAKGIGGKSALKYLIEVEGWDFLDAALHIKNLIDDQPPIIQKVRKQYKNHFRLPRAAYGNDIVINYLVNERFIDKDIVEYCINNYLIYEAEKDHAVVFVGYDSNHRARYASIRATDSDWKQDVYGSEKAHSFSIYNEDSIDLHVFESAIDLLSYMTLLKRSNKNYFNSSYLSISGASVIGSSVKESSIPIALENFLNEHATIKTIYLHLDNDKAGKDTSKKITFHLQDKYKIIDEHPRRCKDINELLESKVT